MNKSKAYQHLFISLGITFLLIVMSYYPGSFWDKEMLQQTHDNYLEQQIDFLDQSYRTQSNAVDWAAYVLQHKGEEIQLLKHENQLNKKDNFYLHCSEKSYFFPKEKTQWIARIKIAQIFEHESDFGKNYYYFIPKHNQPKHLIIINSDSSLEFHAQKEFKNTTLLVSFFFFAFLLYHFIQFGIYLSKIIMPQSILQNTWVLIAINSLFFIFLLVMKPAILYEIPAFNSLAYQNSILNLNLGELIILSFLIISPLSLLNNSLLLWYRRIKQRQISLSQIQWSTLFYMACLFTCITFINKSLHDLMLYAEFTINPKNILDLNINSYFTFVYLGTLFWIFFLIVNLIFQSLIQLKKQQRKWMFFSVLAYVVFFWIYYQSSAYFTYYEVIWPLPILLYFGVQYYQKKQITGISSILINIAIISLFSSILINYLSEWKKEERLIDLGKSIAFDRNLLLEYRYNDWVNTIEKEGNEKHIALQDLKHIDAFKESWIRNRTTIITNTNQINTICQRAFEEVPKSKGLKRFKSSYQNYNYFSLLSFKEHKVLILFKTQWIPQFMGIPSNQFNPLDRFHFEHPVFYQKFQKGQKLSQWGSFKKNESQALINFTTSLGLIIKDAHYYYHHYNPINEQTTIVKMVKNQWYEFIFTFSFLFIFYFILLTSTYALSRFKLHLNFQLLSTKVPFLFIIGILVSVSIYAFFIYLSARNNFNKEYTESQNQEMKWIQNYLQHGTFSSPIKLADDLKTIINNEVVLYWKSGLLRYSTLDEQLTFDLGFDQLQATPWLLLNDRKAIITQRKMGTFLIDSKWIKYEKDNQVFFIQIPKAKESFYQSADFKSFTQSIFNVLTLLITLSLVIGTLLSRNITSSLQTISEYLSNIALGAKNKRIPVNGKGEIAQLIKVYNSKVEDLEKSLQLINQQERSLAWRDVAQQVAHEIKNPLTPMKLSTQYLQQKLNEQPAVPHDFIQNYLKGQLTQIDNLVNIVNHFSQFSKLPKMEMTTIKLYDLIVKIKDSYTHQDHAMIRLEGQNKKLKIKGDEALLAQVFNNIFKNAQQAESPDRPIAIKVDIQEFSEEIHVSITDNGIGMNEEILQQIFTPKFTTKGSGSGIGLALSEQIIKEHGGHIETSSEVGRGSIFTLIFPKIKA